MNELRKLPSRARTFIGVMIATGAGALAFRVPQVGSWTGADLLAAAGLAAGIAVASGFALQLRHETETENFDLTDSFLVAGVLLARPSVVVVALALGTVAGQGVRRFASHKIAFNTGVNLVGITAALAIFDRLDARTVSDPLSWLAAALSMAAYFAVNATSVATVIALVERRSIRSVVQPTLILDLGHWLGNVAVGILIARVSTTDWRVLPVLVVPMLLSWYAYRAWLQGVREGNRMRYLYESGRALAGSVTDAPSFGPFLKLIKRMLEADDAQLALVEDGGVRIHDVFGSVLLSPVGDDERPPASYVRTRPGLTSHQVVIGDGESPRGVLVVYRDHPLTDSEASLLDTLARQVSLKLENRQLFVETVDQGTRLSNLVANTTDGIIALDPNGIVLTWNPAMERITGFDAAQAVGSTLDSLLHIRSVVSASPERTESADAEILRSDGTSRWIRCSTNRVLDEEGVVSTEVMVVRDVTAELETERLKANFIATISHELRTPLTPLKGFLVAMKEGSIADTPHVRDEYFDIMLNQTDRLERLVNDLLDVSQIEANQLRVEAQIMDLGQAVAGRHEQWSEGGAQPVRLTAAPLPLFVRADADRVAQVIGQLVANARKFSPADAPIDIGVERQNGSAVVSVTDRGPGIARSEHDRIFAPFHQVDNGSTRTANGAGLGLFIARRLIEAMDGRLWLESTPGEGSTFLFSLPIANPSLAETRLDRSGRAS
jgi:PAS domain S-box-containing protein